jgi:hypothetical protein
MTTLSVILAVIAGSVLYVLCEYAKEIWLEPLREYKRLKASVAFRLTYYADCISGPAPADVTLSGSEWPAHLEAAGEFRRAAAEMAGFAETAGRVSLGIPGKAYLREAAGNLLALSGGVFAASGDVRTQAGYNLQSAANIREALDMPPV